MHIELLVRDASFEAAKQEHVRLPTLEEWQGNSKW